jgi:cytosine/adenosine deaminase-related metal-dependent hydrolase
VVPGLINAHDHLELNHYGHHGASLGRVKYGNVRQWVDDMRPRLHTDRTIAAGRRWPLAARIWVGGFKNLLAGVTLVAHHNPIYPGLHRASPVRVLRRFGWAHSLAMARAPVGALGEPGGEVADRYRATPRDTPFVVHVAEGTDTEARPELATLDSLGALGANTVLVHGVAIDQAGWRTVTARGAGVVWCPASNLALFGVTLDPGCALIGTGGRLALGTDSRLTGARDLLDELRLAAEVAPLSAQQRLALVTSAPAAMLRCAPAGRLDTGDRADLIVIPTSDGHVGDALTRCRRADIDLVVSGGQPRVGDRRFADVFRARRVAAVPMNVDGRLKLADATLVRALRRFGIAEPGVEVVQ